MNFKGVLGDEFEDVLKMIAEVDENGDGKLSFEEFQKAMQEDTNSQKLEAYGMLGGEGLSEKDRVDIEIEDYDDNKTEEN